MKPAKTIEELKKEYEEKLAELKKKQLEVLKKAKAGNAKKIATVEKQLRKQDAHVKIILGGYLLAEIKSGKNANILNSVLQSLKNEKDKELIKSLIANTGELGFDKKTK